MMNTGVYLKIKDLSPQLLVKSLKESIQYYQMIGFQISFQYEDFYAALTKDRYSIHLKQGEPSNKERENRRKNEDLDIVFSVEDIEELFNSVQHNVISVVQPLRRMPYGREFYLADPDGYLLGFIEQ